MTLYHWDLPEELRQRYGGWRATGAQREELYQDWDRYVRVCFEAFGDRVKHWITHNEPLSIVYCYCFLEKGDYKVEEKWKWVGCDNADDSVGRNLLLTHARAVDIYRREFQPQQHGEIGITLQSEWVEPIDDSVEAKNAAQRGLDACVGWFADPVFLGKPNPTVEKLAPHAYDFSDAEWAIMAGSSDL